MPSIIEVIRDISVAILSKEGDGTTAANDCGCPDNTPSNYPQLDKEANEPPMDFEDDYEVGGPATSYDNICRGSIALTQILIHNLDKSKEVILLGDVNFKSVLPYLASSSLGGVGVAVATGFILPVTAVAILAVVAGLIVLVSVFGYSSVNEIDGVIQDMTNDNLFYCAWLDADTFDAADLTAIAKSIIGEQDAWHSSIRALLRTMIWEERVASVIAGRKWDTSTSPPSEVDWPEWDAIVEDCACDEELDTVWVDLVQGIHCTHARFEVWRRHEDESIITAASRIVQGQRCSDGATMQGPSLDGILLGATQGSRTKQYFESDEGDYFELEISYFTGVGVSTTFHVLLGGTQIFSDNRQGVTDTTTLTLENLSAGTHNIGFHAGTGTNQNILHVAKLRKIAGP